MHFKSSRSWAAREALSRQSIRLGFLAVAGLMLLLPAAFAQPAGGKYVDAKFCSDTLQLNPGSDFDGGSCQLWRLVPGADGWSRLQLKYNSKFLDAKFCRDDLNMNAGSNYDNGSCQLWRFVPAEEGWARLQLKRNGKFLDASYCSGEVKLSGESSYAGGACQLWRLVPAGDGWSRLQIKFVGGDQGYASDGETWEGQSYGWRDGGWNRRWHRYRFVHRKHVNHFKAIGHHGAKHFKNHPRQRAVHFRSGGRRGGGRRR